MVRSSGLEKAERLSATTWLFSEGLDLSRVNEAAIARAPLTVAVGDGLAVIYRYGAAVLFGVESEAARAFIDRLGNGRCSVNEDGDPAVLVRVPGGVEGGANAAGELVLRTFDLSRLRVVASTLSRSAILSYYEQYLEDLLLDLEPLVVRLRAEGRLPGRAKTLLRGVGEVLNVEMRMIGRAEVSEKPEFLWDEPELDGLYLTFAEEYELVDRDRALSRKLELAMRTTSMLMEALAARRALHVEWAIFGLILAEVLVAF